ncbi:MAG: hypothetical protein ABI454_08905 [Sphingomicrobium sp.]
MIFTLPLAIGDYFEPISGDRHLLADIYLAGLPIWIAFALVLASSIVIGLPFHFLLQKWNTASRERYVLGGTLAGFIVPLIVLLIIGAVAGFWMTLLGAFSGAATALSWSKSLGLGSYPAEV